MGMELYGHFTVFRGSVETAERYLKESLKCQWSAAEELACAESTSRIHDPVLSQTLCTLIQVALVDLLQSWGISPDYIVGHSSGEIAGAYCRGALSREAAWTMAFYRGLLSSSIPNRIHAESPKFNGGMLAVGASSGDAEKVMAEANVTGKVVLACINSSKSVTLSGDSDALQELERVFQDKGVFARRLRVNIAYHSPHVERIAADYFRTIHRLRPHDSDCERLMFSSVTGQVAEPCELGPRYFVDNLVSPVRFSAAVDTMLKHSSDSSDGSDGTNSNDELAVDAFLEISPHSALQGPLRQILSDKSHKTDAPLNYAAVLLRGESGVDTALSAAGFVHGLGVDMDFELVNEDTGRMSAPDGMLSDTTVRPKLLVDLPAYSWDHRTVFKGLSGAEEQYEQHVDRFGALLGAPCPVLVEGEHVWRRYIRPSQMKWLYEHEIDGAALFPAAAHLILALEAAQEIAEPERPVDCFVLRHVGLHAPLIIPDEGDIEMTVQMRPHQSSATWKSFSICACSNGQDLRQYCTGLLKIQYSEAAGSPVYQERLLDGETAAKQAHLSAVEDCSEEEEEEEEVAAFYPRLAALGLRYGLPFQNVSNIQLGPAKCIFGIEPQPWDDEHCRIIHPGALDAMIHSIFAACKNSDLALTGPMVPVFFDEISVSATACNDGTTYPYVGSASVRRVVVS